MSNVIRDGDHVHIPGLEAPDIVSVLTLDAARRIVADIRASIAEDAALCDEIDKALGGAA
jgi:hypothetical protein